ncbi:polyketide synthase [Biscogniauxia mediterranea]|nr:polyketide synthase [Biscogniauxia mediterranea]
MDEPIAIIGLDARFPGDGSTAEKFYELLLAGRSARTEIPKDRYNVDAFWHPDANRNGTTRVRHGHFLNGSISAFDAPFFSITPKEASSMDPQQRGMLESVYKALENAGIPLDTAAGSQTGVYVGCFSSDYKSIMEKDLNQPLTYGATGNVVSMLSNRISWFFDFRGPSITIDTACSSSLVAAHQACMSLKLRETSMAIVGGSNLILSPELGLTLDKAGVLGPDGKSYSFDSRANGYSRGEGFGVIVLKRVSDAIRDGDTIRAVIRNSGSNQDGRSPGITQPTRGAQADLIRQVYSRAGLDPSLTRFFEAHGTGTAVGDPIETSAIADIFAPHRSPESPLYVGALKSNVGHLEGAAGVAAIIKGIYTLEQGIIPANALFQKLNPKIQPSWNLEFPTEATPWPQSGLRRMSINSFGVGGANAHMVLDDALNFLKQHRLIGNHRTVLAPQLELDLGLPHRNGQVNGTHVPKPAVNGINGTHHTNGVNGVNGINGANGVYGTTGTNGTNGVNGVNGTNGINGTNGAKSPSSSSSLNGDAQLIERAVLDHPQLYVWSSHDQDGVTRVRESYEKYLRSRLTKPLSKLEELRFLKDLSYTVICKRTHHDWRSFSVARSQDGLQKALSEKATTRAIAEPRLAFIFTGQGAQWPAMGRELMSYAPFRRSLYAADKYFSSLYCPWSVVDELCKDKHDSRINSAEFSQPICTVLQIALVDLLFSWNIYPHVVAGHSSGEVAAAYAAGCISRKSAWRIAYYRGMLCAKLSMSASRPKTGMAAVALDREQSIASIERVNGLISEGTLEVACMNSQESHTISGDLAKVDALVDMLTQEKIFARKLNVEMAYHSRHMKAIYDEYVDSIGQIEDNLGQHPHEARFFSSTRGTAVSSSELCDPAYWADNLVSPVRFHEAVSSIFDNSMGQSDGIQLETSFSESITDLLEIGPHSALKGPLRSIVAQAQKEDVVRYHSALRRFESAVDTTLEAAGSLWSRGYNVDLIAVNGAGPDNYTRKMLIDLPSYPFNHSKEYWFESRLSKAFRFPKFGRHELLGAPVADWNKDNAVWRNRICLSENPWMEDHRVSGDILYPAAGMLVMAIEASRQISDTPETITSFRFKDISFHRALRIPDDPQGVESHFYLRPWREATSATTSTWSEFQLFTLEGEEWREHCRGYIQTEYESRSPLRLMDGNFGSTNGDKTSPEEIYDILRDSGNEFGPVFRTLEEVWLGPSMTAVARVKSPVESIREQMPHQYLQPHLIHPATLDGVLQANLVPLVHGLKGSGHAMVPYFAKELWVSSRPLGTQGSYLVSTQAKRRGPQKSETSFSAISSETREPMIEGTGFVLKSVPVSSSSERRDTSRHIAFNIDWKPDPDFVDPQRSISGMIEDRGPSHPLSEYEALSLEYMRRALKSGQVDKITNMQHHHKLYVSYIKHVVNSAPKRAVKYNVQELQKRPEGSLIVAVGQALPQILKGELDPLEVFFNTKLAEDFYQRGFGAERCFSQLSSYVDVLAHKNPGMRFLEVGAGTGGATRSVMDTLSRKGQRYDHFDFTDLSPAFFEEAREVFQKNLGRMSFRVLNIEKNPLDQGFEAGTYDIIVASNVLHATKNIEATLRNVRSLLKPGGKLLLYEGTNPTSLSMNMVFGTLPGWWLSEEPERAWGPLMTTTSWDSHLKATGFSGLDSVFPDFPDPADQVCSILVSTASAPVKVPAPLDPACLLVQRGSSLQKAIAWNLADMLAKETKSTIAELDSVEDEELKDATCVLLVELENPVLEHMSEELMSTLKRIMKHSKALVWLTRDAPDHQLVTGLARVIRAEKPGFKFITMSFDHFDGAKVIAEQSWNVLRDIHDITDNSFRVVNGLIQIPRIVEETQIGSHVKAQLGQLDTIEARLDEDPERGLSLQIGTIAQLDTLRFEDDPLYETPLKDHEVEFNVMACGVSYRDVGLVLGQLDDDVVLGVEASGVVTRVGPAAGFKIGDRVFGLSTSGTVKNFARTRDSFLAKVPDSMSWTEAASIPFAYSAACAVLLELGNVRKGDTILVHSAAGAFGQAAIQIAQQQKAEIFATAGTQEKRDFLEATYKIPRDHIFSSRDLSFKEGVLRMTESRGVDIVLNTLSGDALRATWDCVAPFGRFVELGMKDVSSNASLTMGNFERNTRFERFDFMFLAKNDPIRAQRIFQRAVDLVVEAGLSRTTPITVHPFSDVQNTFRSIQGCEHIGKIVLESNRDDLVPMLPSRKANSQFSPTASYVIAGGLGGLGKSIARWMVSRGAKNLILLSRRGHLNDSAKELVTELKPLCNNIATPMCDVADRESLQRAIDICLTYMPPIKGCVQGSLVLKDNRFEHMTLDEWNAALRPKVAASWNLHHVLGADLDFFILLSSMMGVVGNKEQGNYAAGSTFQDALARYRVSQGLSAVSLDLPVIEDVGFVAEKPELLQNMRSVGFDTMREAELHAVLDYHCDSWEDIMPLDQSQVVLRPGLPRELEAAGIPQPHWLQDPLFNHLSQIETAASSDQVSTKQDVKQAATLIAAATSIEEAEKIVLDALLMKLSRVLSVDLSNLDPAKALHAYGVDSLVAVDIRSWFLKELGVELSVFEMTSQPNIYHLAQTLAAKSRFLPVFPNE